MAVVFRKVTDSDFDQIAPLYRRYLEWQRTQPGRQEKFLTASEMRDIYHKRKKGSQALNYNWQKEAYKYANHYGYVAEENGQIVAYFEWGGYPNGKDRAAKCYIAVYKEGTTITEDLRYKKIAEQLMIWTFGELKKLGFVKVVGHISKRMKNYQRFDFVHKYPQRIIPETKEGVEGDVLYERDL